MGSNQVLTVAQMQAAEQAVFDAGTTVEELMETAAGGAAEWIRRVAAGRSVTVLCGPGNNGGDGYVIARRLREFGNAVRVIAPMPPATDAATAAREKWGHDVLTSGDGAGGQVLVDCLFGSGLTRALSPEHAVLLLDLADRHALKVAVDLPSGIESDSGALLNERLPRYDLTLALGAWKFAHYALPGRGRMGTLRLVGIGIDGVEGAARIVTRPNLTPPAVDSHKYTRGLAAIVGGAMPGAAVLASMAAQRSGAGYVKLFSKDSHPAVGAGLVVEHTPLAEALGDDRIAAVLVGPGLGRGGAAKDALGSATRLARALVLDADALVLLAPNILTRDIPILATPHDGELESLCRSFAVIAEGRRERALALAKRTGMVICAKGPDTVIAAPDGRLALAPPAPSWLSVAGSGDVLAGIAVGRMASGSPPFKAACEAVWLHGAAARRCGVVFTPEALARAIPAAYAACL
ncbi:NAD(P)H-hydrate dehydratase [Erythrobacter sp. JK5]|uniref:NAD(P)H-hydrate dehydratase n=1 Tax=Erythrobacter sp. JK5 TaxID=2829500 RepID=UPI001BA4955E|nr:NAD(P)H-hydrate dehydratase [Erythrobacter sp. JK5]QUL38589.1 NAD(P)H-hydrate dehydratase [Erythrobacter sp. JK5]